MPRTTYREPRCVRTDPAKIPLSPCAWCAGRGFVPTTGPLETCVSCDGGTFTCVAGNLGPTRTHPVHGRPFLFNPGTGLVTVTRGKETSAYQLTEFTPALLEGLTDPRAFQFVRTTGVRKGEVYHLLVGEKFISCDCAGQAYESSARADWRAYLSDGEHYLTCGCVHQDCTSLFLAAGLLDRPAEVIT